MRYGFFAIACALFTTLVSAQLDITALPDCSSKCSIDSIAGTGCALTDYGCMCQNGGLFQLLVPCVMNACSSKTDQQKTYNLFQTACANYHVIPPLPSSLLTSSNTSASSTSSSSSSTTTPTVMFDLSTIPPCAANCAISAITSTSCAPTDYKCFCEDKNFTDNLSSCVASVCSDSDEKKIFDLSTQLCSVNGISITIVAPTNVGGNHVATSAPTTTTPSTILRASTPTPTRSPTSTRSSSTSTNTSTAAAAKFSGSGFVAAAAMAALIVF